MVIAKWIGDFLEYFSPAFFHVMSHCAGPFVINFNLLLLRLTVHKKTACSSSVKTILGKTFAGSPVNACSVKSESVLKN